MKKYIIPICAAAVLFSCRTNYSDHAMTEVHQIDAAYKEQWVETLDKKIKASPGEEETYYRKALVMVELGKKDEAVSLLNQAIEREPETGKYHLLMARLQHERGNKEDALKESRLAESLGMERPELYLTLSQIHLDMNEVASARETISRARALNPTDYRVRLQHGLTLLAEQDTAEAARVIRQSIAANPSDKAYAALVDIALYQRELDTAFFYLNKRLETAPENRELLMQKASLFKETGVYDSAKQLMHRLIALDTTETAYYLELSSIHFKTYRYDSTIFYANKALESEQYNKEALLTLARVYDRRGWYGAAVENYKKILDVDSTDQAVQAELDKLYGKLAYLRRLEREKQQIENLKTIQPKPVEKPQL